MNMPSLQIILVDDDEKDRQLIRWALSDAIKQISIDEMTSGQELMDWLAKQRSLANDHVSLPDDSVTIILLDMHMPSLSSLETLQYLGNMSSLPYMPVVLLTTFVSDQLRQQAYERGIHLLMLKPAGTNGFYRLVEAVKLCYRDTVRIREQQRLVSDFR